jgi:hypothetical protein
MTTKIYFDLDGTVYDLYNVTDWLEKLRLECAQVFSEGNFIGNYNAFCEICNKLLAKGVQFGVITWLPMQASPEFETECAEIKRLWVKKFMPFVTEFTAQSYGVPKQNAIVKRCKRMYLLDDNSEVCEMWKTNKMRIAINVNKGELTTIQALEKIYNEI